jgi:hypothetical protein
MVGGEGLLPANLPPGRNRNPSYRRLGGLKGCSGRVKKISPKPGIEHHTVHAVDSESGKGTYLLSVYNEVSYSCNQQLPFSKY